MKVALLLIFALVIVGIASAETIQVNVSEKSLVIAGDTPNFYGIVKTNTSAFYVTESSTSLSKTLTKLNSIPISINASGNWTKASIDVIGGIISG